MVLTDIMPGNICHFGTNVINTDLVKAPYGFDSVLGIMSSKTYGGKFTSLTIYNSSQTWPRYVIGYIKNN